MLLMLSVFICGKLRQTGAGKVFVYEEKGMSALTIAFS